MTNNSSEITLTTLTPVWTGGADGKSDHLHLTGIIGSLRWWYEVLVRSVGGNACDPGTHSCIYDRSKPDNGLCDVCRVFGTTGWARRFKLVVVKDSLKSISDSLVFNLSQYHPAYRLPGHKWFLPGNPLDGQVTLKIIATGFLDEKGMQIFDPNIISGLFQLVAHHASVGAKPQMGLGVVRLMKQQSMQPLLDHLEWVVARHQQKNRLTAQVDESFPCLQNMFFARVTSNSNGKSNAFDLKYNLRAMFREIFTYDNDNINLRDDEKGTLRHTIMGYVGRGRDGERIGAKIMMSYPYNNGMIRLWGWIPELSNLQASLNDILAEIYYFLLEKYGKVNEFGEKRIPFWLDYDSQRNNSILHYMEEFLMKEVD